MLVPRSSHISSSSHIPKDASVKLWFVFGTSPILALGLATGMKRLPCLPSVIVPWSSSTQVFNLKFDIPRFDDHRPAGAVMTVY